MHSLTTEEIRAGFALLGLETEDQRAQFNRFRTQDTLDSNDDFVCDSPENLPLGQGDAELA